MSGPKSDYMKEADAFSWYIEKDPALRSTVVTVAWLAAPPVWEALVDRLDRATRHVPVFRQRPVAVPGRLATPRWVADPDFDLRRHVRRIGCPAPHAEEAVLEIAAFAAMTDFDRSRPLWEFTLVEGLADGGAALVMKFHHSLTDGIGGVQMALELFDAGPVAADLGPYGELPPVECLDAVRIVGAGLAHTTARALGDVRTVLRASPGVTWSLVRHPVGSSAQVIETVRSIGRMVRPVTTTLSPVLTGRGLGRRLMMLSAGTDELKAAATAAGGTINDGFMAAVTGGLRRYHEQHGVAVGDLLVTLPISIRTPDDPVGGNRITLQRFRVPAGIANPADRIRAIDGRCRAARNERSLGFTELIAGSLNLMPPGVPGSMLKHVDFVASNVPGFAEPVYLCGSLVTGHYVFGPTLGSAVNATLFSYAGRCCIGITADDQAVPEPDDLARCLRQGLDEVLALAPSPVAGPRSRRPETVPGGPTAAPVATGGALRVDVSPS